MHAAEAMMKSMEAQKARDEDMILEWILGEVMGVTLRVTKKIEDLPITHPDRFTPTLEPRRNGCSFSPPYNTPHFEVDEDKITQNLPLSYPPTRDDCGGAELFRGDPSPNPENPKGHWQGDPPPWVHD